eukprot:SAG11_NODE_10858_length_800_cov_44.195435_1_plen_164_part_10
MSVDILTPQAKTDIGMSQNQGRRGAEDFLARIENNKRMVHHRMVKAREYQKVQFDKHHREQSALLQPGSYAYLSSEGILMPWDKERRTKKLRARFYGPFEILDQLGPVSYKLKIPQESKIHDVFHSALLKPTVNFDHSTHGHLVDEFPRPNEDQEFEVERILAA